MRLLLMFVMSITVFSSYAQNSCPTTSYTSGWATFYKLLENGTSDKVKCSFDALNDVKGTKYGALHSTMLQETPAKYCGMCVEMTGSKGTDIVQIVDECPTCKHSTQDIDLSPQAFATIVGDESIGEENVTWKEVSCPWQTPIHIIVQGSNQWYAKVIVGNTVNRIKNVEVMQGGSWKALTRGNDNGWTTSGINEISKSFRVTDIYDEQIIVSGIDFSQDPTNSKTQGTKNFTPCGLSVSTGEINSLEYITVFPNPADKTLIIEGLSDANTIEILSVNGQVVAQQNLNFNYERLSVDVSNLESGIYVIKTTSMFSTGVKTFIVK